jgi:hypothetical protein
MAGRLRIAALCISCASCGQQGPMSQGPMINVTGLWEARPPVSHSSYYYLALAQDGKDIQGAACHFDNGPGTVFHAVPVSGVYPAVLFTVTVTGVDNQPLVERFVGRVNDSGNITGALSSQNGAENLMFRHVDYGLPKECSGSSATAVATPGNQQRAATRGTGNN